MQGEGAATGGSESADGPPPRSAPVPIVAVAPGHGARAAADTRNDRREPDGRPRTDPLATSGFAGHLLTIRPMRLGEILDEAFRLLRDGWRWVVALVVVLVGPWTLLLGIVQDVTGVTQATTPSLSPLLDPTTAPGVASTGDEALVLLLGLLSTVLTFVGVGYAMAAVTRAVALADVGRRPPWTALAGFALRRSWPILASGCTVGVIVGLIVAVAALVAFLLVQAVGDAGFVLGVLVVAAASLPILATLAVFLVTMPAIVVEGRGPVAALRRSFELVRAHFWRAVGLLLLTTVLSWLVLVPVGILALLAVIASGPLGGTVSGVVSIAQWILLVPVWAHVALLLYVDLRSRREGLDLEARLVALDVATTRE